MQELDIQNTEKKSPLRFIDPRFYIKRFPLLWEFFKFAVVGVVNTGIDFGLYFVLTRCTDLGDGNWILLANFIAFSAAATNSYFLNKFWTFKVKGGKMPVQFSKFFLVSLVGLLLNEIILYSLVNGIDLHDLFAKAAAIVVVLFWNYLANKYWTFKGGGVKIKIGKDIFDAEFDFKDKITD